MDEREGQRDLVEKGEVFCLNGPRLTRDFQTEHGNNFRRARTKLSRLCRGEIELFGLRKGYPRI